MTDWREQPKKADSMLVPCWFRHLDVYGYALKIIVGLHQIQVHSTQLTTTLKLTTTTFYFERSVLECTRSTLFNVVEVGMESVAE